MNTNLDELIRELWIGETLSGLKKFISVPAISRNFDPEWKRTGKLLEALNTGKCWAESLFPHGTFKILEDQEKTPILLADIPATTSSSIDPIMFYGHFDKQPITASWSDGLSPWVPKEKNGRLYGRGAADDGYSFFAALTAVAALERCGVAHPRIIGVIETDEESGSRDLPSYLKKLHSTLPSLSLLTILDLSAIDKERIWLTKSLRGIVKFNLCAKVLSTPVHSGTASKIVPDSFDVIRILLDRIQDPMTGELKIKEFYPRISEEQKQRIREDLASYHSNTNSLPTSPTLTPRFSEPKDRYFEAAWSPSLSIIGSAGLPSPQQASAVVRPSTTITISIRVPPTADIHSAVRKLKSALLDRPPFGAEVSISDLIFEEGFVTPELPASLKHECETACHEIFGQPVGHCYEGGSIGILPLLKQQYPGTPFVATGVLGDQENAHGPDESLDLAYTVQLTQFLARIFKAFPGDRYEV